jgi:hypothetical protein
VTRSIWRLGAERTLSKIGDIYGEQVNLARGRFGSCELSPIEPTSRISPNKRFSSPSRDLLT